MQRNVLALLGLLLAQQAVGDITVLDKTPTLIQNLYKTIIPFSLDMGNFPDGKMSVYKDNGHWIINASPDQRLSSPTVNVEDVNADVGAPGTELGYEVLPPRADIPIPGPDITGLRGNGTMYDAGSVWIMAQFRLAETSQPGVNSNMLIGFEHNEDYYAGDEPPNGKSCVFKSIGIRYSNDLGLSWTRSVPIITQQQEPGATCEPFTGSGDFTAMWDAGNKRWVAMHPLNSLATSFSSDPLARPGTWTTVDGATGATAPGFKGPGQAHGDLASVSGSSPSIIHDTKNELYHVVYNRWGGGLVYSSTKDFNRFSEPVQFYNGTDDVQNLSYPSVVGDGGDTLTTDGRAKVYFGGDGSGANKPPTGRGFWHIPVSFGGDGVSVGITTPTDNSTMTTPYTNGTTPAITSPSNAINTNSGSPSGSRDQSGTAGQGATDGSTTTPTTPDQTTGGTTTPATTPGASSDTSGASTASIDTANAAQGSQKPAKTCRRKKRKMRRSM